MKAFELKALLSRIDPNAEVLATTADPKGHGSFANRLVGIGQDRTVRDGEVERPVLVLHFGAADRVWAAKGHGKPETAAPVAVRARFNGSEVGTVRMRSSILQTAWADRLASMATLWGQGDIDLWAEPQDGWEELVFASRAEAHGFAERCPGLVISELVPR